jgi:hypothetical protein
MKSPLTINGQENRKATLMKGKDKRQDQEIPGLLGLDGAPNEAALLLDILHSQQGGILLLSLLRE